MKRWMILLAVVLGASLAGCTAPTTTKTTSDNKGVMTKNQVLNLATTSSLTTLDTDRMTTFGRLNNTIEGLYQANQDGQAQLALAKSVKVNPDKTTYTFTLWKDSYWSNGDLITAHDFVYAWRRALDPRTKATDADLFRGIHHAREILSGNLPAKALGVQAQGNFKLIVHLDHPMAELPQRLAYPLFGPQNERVAKRFGAKYATKPEYQVYAGPFMVSSKGNTAKHWHMVPNPHYWDRKHVYLKRINVTLYTSQKQAWDAYRQGKLDEVRLLTKNNIQHYEHQDGYTARPYSRMVIISYRHQTTVTAADQVLAQKQARLAISHAIDRKRFGQKTYGNTSLPAQGIVPAGLSRGLRAALKYAHLKTVRLTLSYRDDPYNYAMAQQTKQQLTRHLTGLKISLKKRPWTQNKRTAPLNGDLNLTTVRAQYADPLAMLALFTSNNTTNTGHWSNPAYDKLLEQASNAPSFNAQRWRTLLKADGILMKNQGVTPLIQPASTYLVNPHLNGVQFNTVGTQSNFKQAYFVR